MGNIVIIGPTGSGKTTYLAGVAHWSNLQQIKGKNNIIVTPINKEAENLVEIAENVIAPQSSTRGTDLVGIEEMPNYHFEIKVQKQFKKAEIIDLVVRDSAGELFKHLAQNSLSDDHTEIIEDFVRGDVVGCLLLLSGWEREDDEFYSKGLKKFLEFLNDTSRDDHFRIAVTMSKCERGEVWPGRIEPETDIFASRLPRTKMAIDNNSGKVKSRFYALSTFGVLDRRNDPRPNRVATLGKKEFSVLRSANKWKPYNLISPLYWLSTGKRMWSNV
jgi:hypothetical protein